MTDPWIKTAGKRCHVSWQPQYRPTFAHRQSLLPGVIKARIERLERLMKRPGADRPRLARRIASARKLGFTKPGLNRLARRGEAAGGAG